MAIGIFIVLSGFAVAFACALALVAAFCYAIVRCYFCLFYQPYSYIKKRKDLRCRCPVDTPSYRKTNCNRFKIHSWDIKIIIFLHKGVVNLQSQSHHALSTFPITIAGGINKFCLCKGVPKKLFIYLDRHSITEVKTIRENTRFFILNRFEGNKNQRIKPLPLAAYSLSAIYQFKLEKYLIFEHPSIPFWFHKLKLPISRGHINLVDCDDRVRWHIDPCITYNHFFLHRNGKTILTD